MIVRPATSKDEDRMTVVLEASYSTLLRAHYTLSLLKSVLPVITKANSSLLASGSYFVAQKNGEMIVGCGGWTPERPDNGEQEEGVGHIRRFAAHPDHTGDGVGRAIYEVCEAQARSGGVTRFEAYATLSAVGFYRALGFTSIERIDVRFASFRCPSLKMVMNI
ncbi:MAG: GNAT family N-acetyltransferase [Pseudomonadota bacterium]